MTPEKIDLLKRKGGKGSIGIRAFLEYVMDADEAMGWMPLREGYAAAIVFAEKKGSTISIPLLKNCRKDLVEAGLMNQRQVGRKYEISITEAGAEFWGWFTSDEPDYGMSEKYAPAGVGSEEAAELEDVLLKDEPLGIHLTDAVPRMVWHKIKKYKDEHQLNSAFVPEGYDVFIRKTGTQEKPIKLMQIPGASVGDE